MMRVQNILRISKEDGRVQITSTMVEKYWQHLQEHETWPLSHPGKGHMPLGMHGDDGRYNMMGDRVILVTLNFILARDVSRFWPEFLPVCLKSLNQTPKDSTLTLNALNPVPLTLCNGTLQASVLGHHQKRYPLFCLREFIALGHESLHPIMEQITWSLNQLAIGIHPKNDFYGKPYRGRYAPGTQIAGLFDSHHLQYRDLIGIMGFKLSWDIVSDPIAFYEVRDWGFGVRRFVFRVSGLGVITSLGPDI